MPMAFKFRTSKFRHVYGTPSRKDQCYENVRITRNTHDGQCCTVNPKYIAVVTESGGGGSFLVLPLKNVGRVDINSPTVCGHAGPVLDIKWNPFNDNIIASSSEDNSVKVWQIPESGLRTNLTEWQVDLHGHQRRVGYIEWHPAAENILISAGLDYKCILWNVEQAEPINVISCHDNSIFSISWNWEGSLIATTCKDKKIRVIDPRRGNVVAEADCHQGNRASKAVFLGDTGKIFTTGANTASDRQYAIWDVRNMTRALCMDAIDSSSGLLFPYYDHDTRVVYIAGKGDGSIRYYEITDEPPYCHYLNSYQSPFPQRSFGVMPKRGCDASKCEVMRFYKLHASKNLVEPISMIVPRKSMQFQDDIFVPTRGTIPSLSADEWISGQSRDPILVSMKDGHVTNSPKMMASNAVQKQDSSLTQAPTITTYKAVNRPGVDGRMPVRANTVESNTAPSGGTVKNNNRKEPASLRNIKCLSTNDEYLTINDKGEISSANSHSAITRLDNKGQGDVKAIKKVWSPTSPTTKDITRNGFTGSDNDKIHIKKVWSVPQTTYPTMHQWPNGLPYNEIELRTAYFKQGEEIKSLKEQLALKDKRIRQLEQELEMVRLPGKCGPGESDC